MLDAIFRLRPSQLQRRFNNQLTILKDLRLLHWLRVTSMLVDNNKKLIPSFLKHCETFRLINHLQLNSLEAQ